MREFPMLAFLLQSMVPGFAAGTKLGIAFPVSRCQSWLKGRTYHALLIGGGLLLVGLGLLLAWQSEQNYL